MKRIVKKILIIIGFIILFCLSFFYNMQKYVTNLDELWNYNTARCIMNGLTPYKDISMITTPLFPFIVSIILKCTTDQLFIFRIISSLLFTLILLVTYKIFNIMNKRKIINLCLVLLIGIVYYSQFTLDYNYFCLFLFLIIEYLQLVKIKIIEENKNDYEKAKENVIYNNSIKNRIKSINKIDLINIAIGLLAGCAICTKHTIGAFITLYVLIIAIIKRDKEEKIKEEIIKERKIIKSNYIKEIALKILGILIPVIIFTLFLLINSAWKDFIDYALLGIKTFSNSISYGKLLSYEEIQIPILAVIIPINIILMLIIIAIKRNSIKDKYVGTLAISSLPMLIVIYPIADLNHFLVASYCTIICLLYELIIIAKNIFVKINNKEKHYAIVCAEIIITYIIIIYACVTSYTNFKLYKSNLLNGEGFNNYKERITNNKIPNHFYYVPLSKSYIKLTNELKKYIDDKTKEGYNVIICDAEAVVYSIPLDKYNKNYDMFLKGNIGKDGETGIINNIKNNHKTIYLIKNSLYKLNWQSPTDVLDYIRNNLTKDGELDIFEIYKYE